MKQKFAFGVDLGWVSQLEAEGFSWVDHENNPVDPIKAAKQMGADSVRLRVFVNPPKESYWEKCAGTTCMLGYCDAQSILKAAKRVKENEMRLMIDFHYSDHFADPDYQDIPEEWADDTDEQLMQRIYQHTKDVLTLLTENGIFPEWVQVGNEINNGIMIPRAGLKTAPELLVKLLNVGYDAVKECCPECLVITHLAGIHSEDWCVPFLDNFFKYNGKTDILGFSHYPYWYVRLEKNGSDETQYGLDFITDRLHFYHEKYKKPVMIAEVGGEDSDAEGTRELIKNTITALNSIPNEEGTGIFYWEPEVNRSILPDSYPLGAAASVGEKLLQYSDALSVYKEF